MGKLKLSKRDVKAVKDSVAHWKRDIMAKLKKGIKIKEALIDTALVWADNSEPVKCQSEDCPLCQIYYTKVSATPCVACPYYKKYGIACFALGGHWKKFRLSPCLETCDGMIIALKNILK